MYIVLCVTNTVDILPWDMVSVVEENMCIVYVSVYVYVCVCASMFAYVCMHLYVCIHVNELCVCVYIYAQFYHALPAFLLWWLCHELCPN